RDLRSRSVGSLPTVVPAAVGGRGPVGSVRNRRSTRPVPGSLAGPDVRRATRSRALLLGAGTRRRGGMASRDLRQLRLRALGESRRELPVSARGSSPRELGHHGGDPRVRAQRRLAAHALGLAAPRRMRQRRLLAGLRRHDHELLPHLPGRSLEHRSAVPPRLDRLDARDACQRLLRLLRRSGAGRGSRLGHGIRRRSGRDRRPAQRSRRRLFGDLAGEPRADDGGRSRGRHLRRRRRSNVDRGGSRRGRERFGCLHLRDRRLVRQHGAGRGDDRLDDRSTGDAGDGHEPRRGRQALRDPREQRASGFLDAGPRCERDS
ncbi:MAG: hypothetical protein RJA16_1805, partial [Planctomycetota bacterium]